jgi:dienelactone hydrolase
MEPALSERKEGVSYKEWKEEIRAKFVALTGLDKIAQNTCPLNFQIEKEEKKDGYKQIRFTFNSEIGETVPCYLLIPDAGKEKYPVAITMQGHSSGFHNSISEPKNENEIEYACGRGAFAVQAVKNGYIALAIEQRGMGERLTKLESRGAGQLCRHASMRALLLGRTILGERIWDIHKAIDVLGEYFPQCDMDKILITGNSGGGTATYYSACYDERIKMAIPSCAVCSYIESIGYTWHCSCNYVPNAAKYFDMGELAALIAPRKLLLSNGQIDHIFHIEGTREVYSVIEKIYKKAGAEGQCELYEHPKGHFFDKEAIFGKITRK